MYKGLFLLNAQILLALKKAWQHTQAIKQAGQYMRYPVAGAYRSTVGVISLGMIGRMVCEHLRRFDLRCWPMIPWSTPKRPPAVGRHGARWMSYSARPT